MNISKSTIGRLAAGCVLGLALALPAAADEPVWPSDFDTKVAANIAAAPFRAN